MLTPRFPVFLRLESAPFLATLRGVLGQPGGRFPQNVGLHRPTTLLPMKTLRSLAFTFLAVLLLAPPGRAGDAVVTTLEDEFDSPSAGGLGISLREAIRDVGNSGGTITFDPSLDGGVIELKDATQANGGLLIKPPTTINMVIDALALPRGLTVAGTSFDVQTNSRGVVFRTPKAGKTGTAFFLCSPGNASSLTLRGLTFKDGTATAGGGLTIAPVSIAGTSLRVERCTFSGGQGSGRGDGAALYVTQSSANPAAQVVIDSCTFVDNGMGNINNTTASLGGGGAIQARLTSGDVTVTNCTFTRNVIGLGETNQITRAQATALGGAILLHKYSGTFTLSHCTITGNRAPEGGAGLAVVDSPNATVIVENSLISGNRGLAGPDVLMANLFQTEAPPKLTLRGVSIVSIFNSQRTDATTGGTGVMLGNKAGELKLAPLDNYGGRTQTIALNPGSPAIDRASDPQSGLTDDQCGNPRKRGPRCDIGAFEYAPFSFNGLGVEVTTRADELDEVASAGTGISLREALRDAPNGAVIGFAPGAFATPSIALNPAFGPLRPRLGVTYTIDASRVGGPLLELFGALGTQILQVDPGVTLTLRRFAFKGGNGQQGNTGNFVGGGAISNGGKLTLIECSVEGNISVTRGGGIENNGTLLAQRCTWSGNTANTGEPDAETGGGAVANLGKATFENCTFSGNSAQFGGAIDQGFIPGAAFPALSLKHCTLTGNNSTAVGIPPDQPSGLLPDSGGGIYSFFDWTLEDSIVAGNTPNDVTNGNDGGFQRSGLSAVGKNIVKVFIQANDGKGDRNFMTGDPMLGALGDNGGPTQTIALQTGSPAIDAAKGKLPTDQRGFSISSTDKADIGAFEFGAFGAGQFKAAINDSTTALPERAGPAAAPIVITSGDSELTLDVKADGSFKGTLTFLGAKYSFRGQFDEDRNVSLQLTGRNLPPLTLELTLSGLQDNYLQATVTGNGFSGGTDGPVGETTPKKKYLAPPELIGRYTSYFFDTGGNDLAGVFSFEVMKTGSVHLIGSLFDGTKFTLGTRLHGSTVGVDVGFSGRIPLYKKKGFLNLQMTANAPGAASAFTGRVDGLRPPGVGPLKPASLIDGFYFTNSLFDAFRYLPPAKGAPILPGISDSADGMKAILYDVFSNTLATHAFTLPPTGIAISSVTGFKLRVNPKLGIIIGTVPNPTVGATPPVLPFAGLLIDQYGGIALSKDANTPYSLDFLRGPVVP